mmetsp:Transcript_15070/g.32940  ORF Transcript_15070/g.32940 Transcript_15070/m.32940 type:complete len:200 (+) Transcript_15070:104-703(+)
MTLGFWRIVDSAFGCACIQKMPSSPMILSRPSPAKELKERRRKGSKDAPQMVPAIRSENSEEVIIGKSGRRALPAKGQQKVLPELLTGAKHAARPPSKEKSPPSASSANSRSTQSSADSALRKSAAIGIASGAFKVANKSGTRSPATSASTATPVAVSRATSRASIGTEGSDGTPVVTYFSDVEGRAGRRRPVPRGLLI